MTPQVYMQLTPASDTKRVSHRPTMSDTASAGVRFQDSYLGEVGGETIIRYDNAHERPKGHERHTQIDIEYIDFPGMLTLYNRFKEEAEELSPVSWDWSP